MSQQLPHTFFEQASLYPTGDGWTLPFFFDAVAGSHGEIRGRCRPLAQPERDALLEDSRSNPDKLSAAIPKILAQRITAWNVTEWAQAGEGQWKQTPAEINAASVRRVPPAVYERLLGMLIYGNIPSDIDPQWAEQDKSLMRQSAIDALAEGKPLADAAVDLLAKN